MMGTTTNGALDDRPAGPGAAAAGVVAHSDGRARHLIGFCTGSLAMAVLLTIWPGWASLDHVTQLLPVHTLVSVGLALTVVGLWGRRSSLLGVLVGLMTYPVVRWAAHAALSWCLATLPGPLSINR